MHKEAQQAAGGPTSLGATSEEGAYPHLSSGANKESRVDDILLKVKQEDLSNILRETRSAFFTPGSLPDEPIIILDESKEEEEVTKDKDTEATSHDVPKDTSASYPDINQLTELLVTSLKPELSKLLALHDFASCLPTELKELPLKITGLSKEIKGLKKHVSNMEIELPGDLKEIPTKLETFTSTISSLSTQVAELKNIQWELPAEFLNLPSQVSSVQERLKILDSLPCFLHKVTDTLNKFATMVENALGVSLNVPSTGKATASPTEGEKNTKDAETNLQKQLIDLLGIEVVEQYHSKKLLFDKYYDKMLKRKKRPKITNCEVLTKKGPITLKIYGEDGSDEVISNIKVSDLHSAGWREVIRACPDKSEKGWKTKYDLLESLKLVQRQLFRSIEDWEVSSLQCMQRRSRVLGLNKWYQSLLRDFDLRSITFQTSQSQTEMDPYVTSTPNSTKLPILDTGKFEQWKFRIQQYLQHEHYALWEVIEFGDSYRAPAQDKSVSGEATPSSRSKGRTVAVTAEDMQKRRNDVKARTTLLLALPDEHQLRFSKYETAKELWEAILRTFGGNEATKKTKKNLLKQQYGNFKAEGSETLEQTFNRLQAIVSQLEFLDVPVEQEDLNQKFLTSLSPEWLMHTIVWRNRNDLDTMSLDDLYNHLKVYESEVQKKGGSSSQNMAFVSSSNTNSGKSEVPTTSGQVTTASIEVATATFSHDTIYRHQWNMALLSMRVDRFWKKTGKKITIQGSDVAGFNKSKVECFNCHKLGHFAREYKAPMSQDRKNEASENQALVAEEVVPTEFALMAMSSSSSDNEVYDDSFCSKSCRKNIENLTTKISKLREELFDCESDLCNYKRGLSQVEARLVEFKINESKFCKKIRILERDLELKNYKIENLTNELKKVKKERDGIDSKLEKFVSSSKDLDQMLESQKIGKDKKGVGFNGYRAVPPPPAQVYSSPMPDLSWTSLPEFADNTVTDYTRPTPSVDVTNDVRSELDGNNLTVCEHGGTSSNAVSKPIINFVKESGCPNVIKINNIENARKPTAKYAELYRNITQSSNVRSNNFGPPIIEDWDSEDESDTESTPIESIRSTINQNRDQPRGNQRNWNNLKSQQLGKDFVMQNKACYKCGSFEHLKVNCNKNKWVNKGKNWSRVNYTQGNLTPKAILLKSGTKTIAPNRSFSTARTSLNVAQPKMKSFVKSAHSNVKRPFERKAVAKNKIWVPTVRTKNPTVGLKVPTAKPTVAAAKGNKGKAVKASARWIWKPKQISGEGSNVNGVSGKPLDNIDDKGFWDSGCSRHMTGNISYLSDYEPYDGGYVSFGYGGGKITGKGTIKTGRDFKLEDDRHVLLRTPRQQNICDNGDEFRNKEMDYFCSRKGIKREFSNARTPQQNGVAKRRNRTLIEAARTMMADAKLPVTFWAEAINTA
ncbi:ribonuclease H-like domain-containing protein [Tanacetum coccineum]